MTWDAWKDGTCDRGEETKKKATFICQTGHLPWPRTLMKPMKFACRLLPCESYISIIMNIGWAVSDLQGGQVGVKNRYFPPTWPMAYTKACSILPEYYIKLSLLQTQLRHLKNKAQKNRHLASNRTISVNTMTNVRMEVIMVIYTQWWALIQTK